MSTADPAPESRHEAETAGSGSNSGSSSGSGSNSNSNSGSSSGSGSDRSAHPRDKGPAPRPLAGRVVLVPRLREPDPLARALRTAGAAAVRAALTRTVPGDAAELASASARLAAGEYDWLVVTSARTVEMLDVGAAPVSTAVAAVGSATARVLAAALGRDPDLVAGGSARALLEALAGRGGGPRLPKIGRASCRERV